MSFTFTKIVFLLELIFLMNTIFFSLGTNLGNRSYFLQKAIQQIQLKIGNVSDQSSVYETEPWGFNTNQTFLNQVIKVDSKLLPLQVLTEIKIIELELGRTRGSAEYESRNIDIDILFFNDMKIEYEELTIPHPKLHLRNFTLIPLAEIAAEFIHPIFGERLGKLAQSCADDKLVEVYCQSQITALQEDEI